MSYGYGSNVFSGATVTSISETGANVDDNAIVNNTDYWESGDPAQLFSGGTATASSTSGSDAASYAADGLSGGFFNSWIATSDTNEWWKYDFGSGTRILVNRWRHYSKNTNENKDFLIYGSNDGSSWTLLHSDTKQSASGWDSFDFNPCNYTRYRYIRCSTTNTYGTYNILSNEYEAQCWTPWITITPTTARTVRKITIKLHEVDNANGVRIYGQDADGDWTLLAISDLANVTTEQDIILNTATSYPTYVVIFTGFRGGATHAKVDFIGGYEVEETEETENVTGVTTGSTSGNFFYDNLLYRASPTFTTTSEASGYEDDYLWDKNQGATWRSTAITDQTIKVALDGAYNQHGIVLLNHNLDASLDTVTVEYSADDFTTIGASGTLTINDDIAYFASLAPLMYQYVRITISTTGAVRSYFEIGQMFVAGGFYDFAKACRWSYTFDRDAGYVGNRSSGGQEYGASRYWRRIYSAEFKGIGTDQRLNFEDAERRRWVVFSPDGSSGPVWFGTVDFSNFEEFQSGYWSTSMVFEESPT